MKIQLKTEYDKWLEFCKEIMGRVQDKEFLSNIMKLLDELDPYKVRVKNNTLTCVLRKNGSKKIVISISDNKVFYKVEEKDVVKTGTYQVSNNGKRNKHNSVLYPLSHYNIERRKEDEFKRILGRFLQR